LTMRFNSPKSITIPSFGDDGADTGSPITVTNN
jgi:hypothetical protein